MPLSPEKKLLLGRVQDAVYASGWSVLFENADHPTFLRVLQDDKSIRLLIYIWRLTPGGPAGVRPAGELRVQLTGVSPPLRRGDDFTTLLLGWHQPSGMFAGFDVSRRPHVWGASPSVQIRESAIKDAQAGGFGTYRRATSGEGEIAVAFAADAFMDYVLRQGDLHEFAQHAREAEILHSAAKGEHVDLDMVRGEGRRQAVRTVMQRVGQENFRSRILSVYGYRCALCEIQLDLVGAAHIVPVAAGGNNATPNGLALCSLHHESYDRALVGVLPDYRIRISEPALNRLRRLGRSNRWENFRENLRETIHLPMRPQDRPEPGRLEEGLRVRGWS